MSPLGQRRAFRAPKANGAGIAADPTLTDAWASFPWFPSGKPVFHLFQDTLGIRCLSPFAVDPPIRARGPVPSACPEGHLPRLASSPALAPASGTRFHKFLRLHSAGALLGRSACFREAETVRLSGSRSRTVVIQLPFQRPQSRTKLAVFHVASTSRLSQAIRLASGQDLRHDVSRQTRGQLSTRSLDHKTLSFQCLAARLRWRLLFRRQDQTAPESAFRQGRQEPVIHFSPDHLWTAVDNSTVHRIR